MRKTNTGFTLGELLIVVAIIAVLVAVAIPVFSSQHERSREGTDAANIRSHYGQVMAEAILTGKDVTDTEYDNGRFTKVSLRQKRDGWQNATLSDSLGGIAVIDGTPTAGGSAWVTFSYSTNNATIHFSEGSGGSNSTPGLHGTANLTRERYQRGAVIQDDTGTCVIMSGLELTWNAYSGGATVAEIAAMDGTDAVLVDASDIKDSSFTGTLNTGDLYYDSAKDLYYYVTLVSIYESWPNSAWQVLYQ